MKSYHPTTSLPEVSDQELFLDLLERCKDEVNTSALQMRPAMIDRMGIQASLREILERLNKGSVFEGLQNVAVVMKSLDVMDLSKDAVVARSIVTNLAPEALPVREFSAPVVKPVNPWKLLP